jgi:hypothetical protein
MPRTGNEAGGRFARPVRQAARMRSVLGNRRLGDALLATGALTNSQLRRLLDLQVTREEGWLRLGELAVLEGFITERQPTEALIPYVELTPQLSPAA